MCVNVCVYRICMYMLLSNSMYVNVYIYYTHVYQHIKTTVF